MTPTPPRFLLVLLPAALALAACDTLDQSKDWFSRSDHDPEIEAIERQVPPPEEPFSPAAAVDPAATGNDGAGHVKMAGGGLVVAEPPRGMVVRLGASTVASSGTRAAWGGDGIRGAEADLAAASSETGLTRSARPPPLGYARVRLGSHGTAVGPFRSSPSQSFR